MARAAASRKMAPTENAAERALMEKSVQKSYEIVSANFDEMTLKEAQILALAVSKIPKDMKANEMQIRVKIERNEVDTLFGINGYKSDALKSIAEDLQRRVVTVRPRSEENQQKLLEIDPNEEIERKRWKRMVMIPTAEYMDGVFILSFNTDLNEQFIEMRDRMISYSLSHVVGMTSPYHMRLYEILVMGLQEGGSEFRIEPMRLQAMLGAYKHTESGMQGEIKYKRFFDFKTRVLDPSVTSVNSKTNLNVEYTTVKHGREIKHILFKVETKQENEIGEKPIIDEVLTVLEQWGIARNESSQWIASTGNSPEEIMDNIQAAQNYIEQLKARGKEAHENSIIKRAILQGWKTAERPAKKTLQPKSAGNRPTKKISKNDINIELCIEILEIDQEISTGFWRTTGRDLISEIAYRKEGYSAKELVSPILEYFVREINAGITELLDFVGLKKTPDNQE